MAEPTVTMDKMVSLCKRRGFIFQSSEIYGGQGGAWDYGPLGVELKNNVKRAWWRANVYDRPDVVGLDAAILMHPRVWQASGHVGHFTDPMVDCRACKHRFREDHIPEPGTCPDCGTKGSLTEARMFNLMFKTFVGPVEEDAAQVYLRPETAQGIFVNFANVVTAMRRKLPFGIAQIGKSFRNEITPGNFTFRSREFEQMELEFFVKPGTDEEWHARWIQDRMDWFHGLGMEPSRLRLRPHDPGELSHYSKATSDIEYLFPMGWSELEGIANRTDYDLKQHSEFSGERLTYFDEETNEHIVPYVIEPAAGVDRLSLAFLLDAYLEEEVKGETRTVLRLHKELAPIKVAILPLSRNEKLVPTAQEVYATLRQGLRGMLVQYDDAQSIGRRYRRQDEVGTPYCVTVDFDSLEDHAVTIRERDSMTQERVPMADLAAILKERLEA
jgi:glycyl-tRNA synthetase